MALFDVGHRYEGLADWRGRGEGRRRMGSGAREGCWEAMAGYMDGIYGRRERCTAPAPPSGGASCSVNGGRMAAGNVMAGLWPIRRVARKPRRDSDLAFDPSQSRRWLPGRRPAQGATARSFLERTDGLRRRVHVIFRAEQRGRPPGLRGNGLRLGERGQRRDGMEANHPLWTEVSGSAHRVRAWQL